jgi:hypothetical protein
MTSTVRRLSSTVEPTVFERRIALWVATALFAANVYYFHRYAFRYNNDETSPTYTDTPFFWQATKYFLMFAATALAWASAWWAVRTPGRRSFAVWRDFDVRPTGGFAPLMGALLLYGALITLTVSPSNDNFGNLIGVWFFLPIVLLVVVAPLGRPSFTVYGWAGVGLIGYHVVFSAQQLLLFVALDRLPALAYENSLTRFGGGLDDPNGFGVIVVLPMLLCVAMWSSFPKRWPVVAVFSVLGVLLFLTLSFSAAIGCIAGFVVLAVLTRRGKLLAAIGATLAVFVAIGRVWSYTRSVIEDKMESALTRFDFGGAGDQAGISDFFSDFSLVHFVFGDPGTSYRSENSYLLILTNFGLIGLGLVIALVIVAFRRGVVTAHQARAKQSVELARLYEGLLAFMVAFAVASIGVPYFEVFPVNMLFWTVAVLAAMGPNVTGLAKPGCR